ncbi:MAG TPA: ABC transporter permease [Chitinophagaceae bacterium]|nr:ABC transporter permease [Chitinophagaceae bacterium]
MIKNYLKIAWRNLMKNKVFSFINVFGLSIGLTCCMLIALYLNNELSYDSYHKNANRIFQLGTTFVKEGKEDRTANTPAPMAKAMQMEFPEIEKATRLLRMFADDRTLFQYTEPDGNVKSFFEAKGYVADSTFFQVLTFKFKEGDAATALMNPNSVVINEATARKIFGKESPVNKTLFISSSTIGDGDFRVTGVFTDAPNPSHIDAGFILSAGSGSSDAFFDRPNDLVSNNMFYTYFLLKPGSDAKKLEAKFPAFIDKHAAEGLKAMGFYKKQFLTPLKDVHLHANTSSNVTAGGSLTYLYILGSIALFTLLIACINFMNLSTARSSKRAAEVGVRKVLGAEKNSLIRQFIGESIMMSMIAFAFALIFTKLLLPLFSRLSAKDIIFSLQEHGVLLGGFFVLALLTGLLAGSYPAFYLSSFQPVKVLKGKITNSLAANSLRKGLVVFQFVISAGLIVASVIINNQMQYLKNKDLGFEKDQQLVIPLRSRIAKNIYPALKEELKKNSQIENVGASMYYPGIINPSDMPLYKEGDNMNSAKRTFMNWIDGSFLQTLGIKTVSGRLFSPEFPADTNFRMILNEEAIRKIGFKNNEDAVGKNVLIDWQGETYRWQIIGVVKDFHFVDLHSAIEPYGFQLNNNQNFNYLIAHTKTNNMGNVIQSVRNSWKRLNPNEPLEYTFLEDDFQKNYEADNRLAGIVRNFTIIAILISCLGLFGLATFSAEQRTKEIGVRKVLGASVGNVVGLLSKEFLKLVFIAILIASPITWFVMNKWLQDFAYRTNISWMVFVITAVIAIGIALLTISFQAIKAAVANPVKSLRTE